MKVCGRAVLNELVRNLNGVLSPSERRIVNALLQDPAGMAALPAKAVAEQVEVHESTVVRLARRLGYTGYTELRADLEAQGKEPETSLDRMAPASRQPYTLAKLAADEITALERLTNMVPQAEVDEIAERVLAARATFLFGPPYAQAVLDLLQRRLTRLGLHMVHLPTSGRLAAEQLTGLTSDDLVISFVFRRPAEQLDRINDYAKNLGAQTAVIADEAGIAYHPQPDQLLVAPRGPSETIRSLIVPFFLCYAIQMAVLHKAPERTQERLQKLDELARTLGNDEPSHGI